MATIQMVKSYKTSDGQLFEKENDARENQRLIDTKEAIDKWIRIHMDISDEDAKYLKEALLKHGHELVEVLNE